MRSAIVFALLLGLVPAWSQSLPAVELPSVNPPAVVPHDERITMQGTVVAYDWSTRYYMEGARVEKFVFKAKANATKPKFVRVVLLWHPADKPRTLPKDFYSPVAPRGLSESPPEIHLDSWKEIATYVKRDVSTVQRWEKRESMPVHRHFHDKRGSVYAVGSELDAWVQSRKPSLDEEEKDRGVETPADMEGDRRPSQIWRLRHWLVLAGVAAVGLVSVTYILTLGHSVNATGPKIKSLAVLPLRNFSGDR